MNVFITGGSGFVGSALTTALVQAGHQVTVLSRSSDRPRSLPGEVRMVQGNGMQPGAWQAEVRSHQAVINLAGATIFQRWTTESKELIRNSRLLTTQHLVQALEAGDRRTQLLLNASAVGYYGSRGDEPLTEESRPGDDFLARLCQDWEETAMSAEKFGIRVVRCRFGIVLGKNGGAYAAMAPAFKLGLGSPLGTGNQWFSWIHRQDLIELILFVLRSRKVAGAVNCTAPRPVTNREMTRALATALHRPLFLPRVPAGLLKLTLGELGSVLLEGQRVLPEKSTRAGFAFRFPEITEAFRSLAVRS